MVKTKTSDHYMVKNSEHWKSIADSFSRTTHTQTIDFDLMGNRLSSTELNNSNQAEVPSKLEPPLIAAAIPYQFTEHISLPNHYFLLAKIEHNEKSFWRMWLMPKNRELSEKMENLSVGVLRLTQDWDLVYVNSYACKLLGLAKEDLLGKRWRSIFDSERIAKLVCHLEQNYFVVNPAVFDFNYVSPLGRTRVMHVSACTDSYRKLGHPCYELILVDITEKYQYEKKLIEASTLDGLTKLLNRNSFFTQLHDLPAEDLKKGSLFFIDVNRFKEINDNYGHNIGDSVLEIVALRLKHLFREDDVIARFGGDEFVVFTRDSSQSESLRAIEHKLKSNLNLPTRVSDNIVDIGLSVGLVNGQQVPQKIVSSKEILSFLLESADMAMYKAKKFTGKAHFCRYDDGFRVEQDKRLSKCKEADRLLDRNNMHVLFQPIYHGKEIVSVEALIRLYDMEYHSDVSELLDTVRQHNDHQEIFRSIFEFELDEYLALCHSLPKGVLVPKLNINVESDELDSLDFLEQLIAAVNQRDLKHSDLYLELTETSLEKRPDQWVKSLSTLNSRGFSLSIDDFGTGYSSLKRLSSSSFNQLKIDRYFLQDIDKQSDKIVFLKAILLLANELGIETLAEGIEHESEFEFLSSYGISLYQGFYFCKPASSQRIASLIKSGGSYIEYE